MSEPSTDQDTPWKEALELFLAQFLAFFFPTVNAAIDWSRGYESLDKELHQISPEADLGNRLADKLFKAWRMDGKEAWLFIHAEVQGKQESSFPERMYVYHYRIFDRFHQAGVSLAVLCDANPNWKPDRYEYNTLGCGGSFQFLVAKVLDYRGNEIVLEADPNPFAAIVLAQLIFLETRDNPRERQVKKLGLIKSLYQRGLDAKQIRQLFRLIDWLLLLPKELEDELWTDVQRFEEEKRMTYVMSFERKAEERGLERGLEKGREEGLEEGLEKGLEKGRHETLLEAIPVLLVTKFGKEGKRLLPEVRVIKDVRRLQKVLRSLKTAKSIDDVRSIVCAE